ncbi:MAG: oligosaccharide repeat unit polymerase [Lachnospiraceae bacterium]|nr:oligosaccharide repeat unit polymerase [Lachnospiraceae bacterium]
MIWGSVIFLIFVTIASYMRYRDLSCPAVLHNFLWIAALIGSMTIQAESEMNLGAIVIICAGSLIFQIGFDFSLKAQIGTGEKPSGYEYSVNVPMIRMVVIIVAVASLPSIYQYLIYIRGSVGDFYTILTSAEDALALPTYFSHFRKIIGDLSLVILAIYWTAEKDTRKNIRKYVIILFVVAVLFVASVPTRNGILSFALPLMILFVCTHNLSNKKIFLILFISILGFMVVYYVISAGKYWYLYENSSDAQSVLFDEIKVYLSGSIVAFGKTFKSHAFMYGGKNTFRFFMAVGDALFGTSSALKLTNEFISVSGISTNVYTFYDFYIRDFGVAYALFAQFIVSCIHGTSYKGMHRGELFQTYMFSMLSYPLIMQFFQDQYLSLLPTWIQIILVGIVVLKTNLFVQQTPLYDDSNDRNKEGRIWRAT